MLTRTVTVILRHLLCLSCQYEWTHLQSWFSGVSAIEIQPVLLSLIQGVALMIWVTLRYFSSLEFRALMRGPLRLMLRGYCGLIRSLGRPARKHTSGNGPIKEAFGELCVQKTLPHLLVLPGCCLPHHLQLLLNFTEGAKRGEKTKMGVCQGQAD